MVKKAADKKVKKVADKKVKREIKEESVSEKGENVAQVKGSSASTKRIPEYMKPWEVQCWKNILTKDEKTKTCTRCNEVGHICLHCPYGICYLLDPDDKSGKRLRACLIKGAPGKYRCGRCGRFGHNRRMCHGPIFF